MTAKRPASSLFICFLVALAISLAGGGAAHAETANVKANFEVLNLTGETLKSTTASGTFDDNPPVIGRKVPSGGSDPWNVTYYFLREDHGIVTYTIGDGTYSLRVDGQSNGESACTVYETAHPGAPSREYNCARAEPLPGQDPFTVVVTLSRAQPTTSVIPPGARASDLMKALGPLCGNGRVGCDYKSAGDLVEVPGQRVVVDNTVRWNCTKNNEDYSISWSHTTGMSNSVGADISVGFKGKVISVGFKASYGHSWSESTTASSSDKMTLLPGQTGDFILAQPMLRSSGDVTLTLGNDTWHLQGVDFDVPDTSPSRHRDLISFAREMTPSEELQFCRDAVL